HRIHDDIADDERRKEILVSLIPRDRFVTGIALNAGGDFSRLKGIGQPNTQFVDQAGLLGKDLARLGKYIGRALVLLADAGMKKAYHLCGDAGALTGLQRDIGANARAYLFRQPVTENDGVGGGIERVERGTAHLLGHLRHARLAPRIDARNGRGYIVIGIADDRLHFHGWRDAAGEPGFKRRHRRERILDAGPACFGGQAVNLGAREQLLGGLRRRLAPLVRHRDVRQCIDEALGKIILRAVHQRRHHDRKPDTGRNTSNGKTRLPHPPSHMRPRNIENEIHGVTRTRAPSLRSVEAGEATRSSSPRPDTTSTVRVPRMPTLTSRLRTRVPSTTKTALPCSASAGTSNAFGFSRVTMLASTLIPGLSGVSSGSAIFTRNVFAATSPIGVISFTLPSRRRSGNASVRNSTICPSATRGMSSSLTSATTCSGFGTPMRNKICPASAISPISPSRRSTMPSIGAAIV